MRIEIISLETSDRGKWFFLGAFWFACVLFWLLPSIVFRMLGLPDPAENSILLISLIAACVFTLGYLIPRSDKHYSFLPDNFLQVCSDCAYRLTLYGAIPAFLVALRFSTYRSGVVYGTGEGISTIEQAILYSHLFFGFMFFGSAKLPEDRRRLIICSFLLILPRLIVSLHWGRFFVAQAILPELLIAVARGWVRLSLKRIVQVILLAAAIVFVPSLTRGDNLSGSDAVVQFFASGSTLRLFQENQDLDLRGECSPLLVSMTAKIIPWKPLGMCVIDIWGQRGLPATLDRILAANEPGADFSLEGPGSNYLLELYLTGGAFAVYFGSFVFGYTCRKFLSWCGQRSLFGGIWAECLTRALLTPRSNLGYVYERIPSLILTTMLFIVIVKLFAERADVGIPMSN